MVLYRSSCQYVVGYMMVMVIVSRHHLVDSFDLAAHFPCRNDNLMERICPTTVCRMVNDQTTSREIEVYNDQGMEFDMQDTSPNENNELKNNKKKIECSASIMLPFSADVAFTAFSDLTRQPSWCKYLHSVEYIGLVNEDDDGTNDGDLLSQEVPLRSSKWTVGVKGLRFSWTASDTRIIRNKRLEWKSISGLRNIGSVVFTPSSSTSSSQSDSTTHMELCFIFVLPRVVSSLYRRLNIRKYTEDVMLADMLERFRDVVIEEDL